MVVHPQNRVDFLHSNGWFPCDETKCRNVGAVLVVAAVESDDFFALVQINFDKFSIASFDAHPVDAGLAIVEVDIRDELIRLDASSDVSKKVPTIILTVEGVGRQY